MRVCISFFVVHHLLIFLIALLYQLFLHLLSILSSPIEQPDANTCKSQKDADPHNHISLKVACCPKDKPDHDTKCYTYCHNQDEKTEENFL